MSIFKTMWNYLFGKVKDLLAQVIDFAFTTTKDILDDKELMALALDAIKAAAKEQLTGEKAFVAARDKFVNAAKDAGKELKDSTVNYIIELVYNSWKNLGKPEE
jgi:hypothetical protein